MRPFSPDEREEFERTAFVYREVLLRVACRKLRSQSLAEDAVQETLLSAWRAFHTFERGSNCRAWLFRILLNGIRRNRRRAVPLAELPVGKSIDTLMTYRPSFESLAQLDATAAVDALPETQRTIFRLAVGQARDSRRSACNQFCAAGVALACCS